MSSSMPHFSSWSLAVSAVNEGEAFTCVTVSKRTHSGNRTCSSTYTGRSVHLCSYHCLNSLSLSLSRSLSLSLSLALSLSLSLSRSLSLSLSLSSEIINQLAVASLRARLISHTVSSKRTRSGKRTCSSTYAHALSAGKVDFTPKAWQDVREKGSLGLWVQKDSFIYVER